MNEFKNIPISKILLYTIATAGIVGMAFIASNVIQSLKIFGFDKKKYSNYYINSTITRLKNKGYVLLEEKNGKTFISLTNKGSKKMEHFRLYQSLHILSKKKRTMWDGKWRIVIFDITEKRKEVRNMLRRDLASLGFIKLQNSVWVSPYGCEEWIAMLKVDFKIGREVLYIVADKIENEKNLKIIFNL